MTGNPRVMPPLHCESCSRRIGRQRTHYVVNTSPPCVLCGRCIGLQRAHARLWPECPHLWHDAWDHAMVSASRAAANRRLVDGIDFATVAHNRRIRARYDSPADAELVIVARLFG